MNLDLAVLDGGCPFGVVLVGCGWFLWFSREIFFDLCGQVFKSTRWMPWH